jgi:two-component system, sensor histidine kinase PdtaS
MLKPAILFCILLLCRGICAQQVKYNLPFPHRSRQDSAYMVEQWITEGKSYPFKDTAQAIVMLRKAIKTAEELRNDFLQGKAYQATGDLLFQQNLYNRSLANYSKASELFTQTGRQQEMAEATLGIAKSQYYRGNYKGATYNFVEAMRQSEKHNLPSVRSEATEYMGLIYDAFQNFQRSTDLYLKSLETKQRLQDYKGVVRVSRNLCEIYYQLAKFDSTLLYADISFNAAEKLGMPTEMYMAKFKKTAALIRLKKLEEADQELRFFGQDIKHRQDANLLVRYETLLGNYWLSKNDEQKSKSHYDSAMAIIKNYVFPELLIIVLHDMAESYFYKQDFVKACRFYKQYNSQLSSFYSGDNLAKLANLEGLVKLESSTDEIKYLSSENTLHALKWMHEKDLRGRLLLEKLLTDSILKNEKLLSDALLRENTYKQVKIDDEKKLNVSLAKEFDWQSDKLQNEKKLRLLLIGGMVLFTALGNIIFLMYRKQRNKSAIIQKQADDLQTLIKEIHHRVKNNLQIISSLLDLQSISIKDKQASHAVMEGKMRVQSMALIHQRLYSEGNLRGIWIQDYIKNMVENLFDSYNIHPNDVKLLTDIDNLNLDVDTVIPLGLILNELITNSLKYAFPDKKKGEIYVSLKEDKHQLQLLVKDNGRGFSTGWEKQHQNSFGFTLIQAFAQKLKAKLEWYNDGGACVSINITRYEHA